MPDKSRVINEFESLPSEVVLYIFQFLALKELGCVALVSKYFKDLADTEILWKNLINRDFNFLLAPEIAHGKESYKRIKFNLQEQFKKKYETVVLEPPLVKPSNKIWQGIKVVTSFFDPQEQYKRVCERGTEEEWRSNSEKFATVSLPPELCIECFKLALNNSDPFIFNLVVEDIKKKFPKNFEKELIGQILRSQPENYYLIHEMIKRELFFFSSPSFNIVRLFVLYKNNWEDSGLRMIHFLVAYYPETISEMPFSLMCEHKRLRLIEFFINEVSVISTSFFEIDNKAKKIGLYYLLDFIRYAALEKRSAKNYNEYCNYVVAALRLAPAHLDHKVVAVDGDQLELLEEVVKTIHALVRANNFPDNFFVLLDVIENYLKKNKQMTLLHYSIQKNYRELAEYIINRYQQLEDKGVSYFNFEDSSGQNALHFAITHSLDLALILLQTRINVNAIDHERHSVLGMAAYYYSTSRENTEKEEWQRIIDELLEAGADPTFIEPQLDNQSILYFSEFNKELREKIERQVIKLGKSIPPTKAQLKDQLAEEKNKNAALIMEMEKLMNRIRAYENAQCSRKDAAVQTEVDVTFTP